jgi:hypothetical protein
MGMQQELPFDYESIEYRRTRPASEPVDSRMSGRRARVARRNHIMVARYYYWTEIRRRRFDDVMRILCDDEFFVEYRTVSNALLEHSDYLNSLYKKKVGLRFFRSEYPSWRWENL